MNEEVIGINDEGEPDDKREECDGDSLASRCERARRASKYNNPPKDPGSGDDNRGRDLSR